MGAEGSGGEEEGEGGVEKGEDGSEDGGEGGGGEDGGEDGEGSGAVEYWARKRFQRASGSGGGFLLIGKEGRRDWRASRRIWSLFCQA